MQREGESGTVPRLLTFSGSLDVLSIELGKSVVRGLFRRNRKSGFVTDVTDVSETPE